MKIRSCLPLAACVCFCLLLPACQGTIEDPEIAALVDEYESLVEEHEGRIAGSRGNPARFAVEVNAFSSEAAEWAERFQARADGMSEADARQVKRRIDDLNRRVQRMITG
jgi:hypothetical protein